MSKTLRIDNSQGRIHITVLKPARLTSRGFGTYFEGLQDDEIEVTAAAVPLVKKLNFRSGLQGAEVFFAPRVIAWPGSPAGIVVDVDEMSCDEDGRNWLLSCVA